MNIARVNIEILLENQTATYFHRSRLFTYDTMKNFNLATLNRKKSIMTACMPLTPLSTILIKEE
jgi:predicted glutamine amidotransferase